ncbi:MAG TPA: hypothetical protein DFS52_03245 [Myxococcales bacterium]|jgi:hypothetical protein|nr:hypothetical protein [Myxococcales bacterium]
MPDESTPTTNADEAQETSATTATKVDFAAETAFFLAQAADVDPKDVRICRADTDLMAANIRRGLASITQEGVLDRIRVELPTVDVAPLLELNRLGETVAFAARNVMPEPKSEELATKTARGRKLRKVFFNQIETFIGTGQINQEEFDKMRKGKGTLDVASDLIDCVALLEKYEPVLGGRLSVTPELLDEGQELGRWLRQTVEPSVSRKNEGLKKNEGSEVRDRLWTLLQRRHRELRRIGAWLWPEEVDKRVPSLLARQRKRKSKEREDAAEGGTESTPVCG